MARISSTSDPAEAAKDADFINESVPENPEIKAKVFAQFHGLCPERTIFTTNTSMLVPSMFAEATGRPAKLCAVHFHDLRASTVVDVMPHPGTDPAVTQLVHDFAVSIGCIVIMLHKENHGYVFNTMLTSLIQSALTLATREVASVEDIDRAWMGVTYMPMGPFGIMDQVGLSRMDHHGLLAKKWETSRAKRTLTSSSSTWTGQLGTRQKGFLFLPQPTYRLRIFSR
jgi:3-hydroxybutyryl-CoA dehydrogenase